LIVSGSYLIAECSQTCLSVFLASCLAMHE
jgi:hypothetical protein